MTASELNDAVFRDLLKNNGNNAGIRFQQEGVMLKGSLVDESRSFFGCLFIAQQFVTVEGEAQLIPLADAEKREQPEAHPQPERDGTGISLPSYALRKDMTTDASFATSLVEMVDRTGEQPAGKMKGYEESASVFGVETAAAFDESSTNPPAASSMTSNSEIKQARVSAVSPATAAWTFPSLSGEKANAGSAPLQGTVVIPSRSPTTNSAVKPEFSSSASLSCAQLQQRFYLVWVPYSYLRVLSPEIMETMQDIPPPESDENDNDGDDGQIEWHYSMCLPLEKIHKLQRKTNLKGQRVIRITRVDGMQECPLIFAQGGITRFFADLKRCCHVRQSSTVADDFIINDVEEGVTGFSPPGEFKPPTRSERNAIERSSRGSAAAPCPTYANGTIPVVTPRASLEDTAGAIRVALNSRKLGESSSLAAALRNSTPATAVPKQNAGEPCGSPLTITKPSRSNNTSYSRQAGMIESPNSGRYSKIGTTIASAVGAVRSGLFRTNGLVYDDRGMDRRSDSEGDDHDAAARRATAEEEEAENFMLVDAIVPVEDQLPRLPSKIARAMGPMLSPVDWEKCFRPDGRLDPHMYAQARSMAFYGGIDPSIRGEVWCFLLDAFPTDSTPEEREEIEKDWEKKLEILTQQWKSVFPEQEKQFRGFHERKQAVEKDVVRTDRWHPDFAADDSPKLKMLHTVLMGYAMYNFDLGYCQGMSDVLSIVALLTESESWAFMVFTHLMKERCVGNFRSDSNMEEQLSAVAVLVKRFAPKLYSHLQRHHAEGMTFCFRWMLILFKREFGVAETPLLWDVLFSCPYTPQFEVFVTAGLLKALSAQIVGQGFTYDELLKFANSLAGNIKAERAIAIAHDFYDQVAAEMVWLERTDGNEERSYRPQLKDVIRVFSTTQHPPLHSERTRSTSGKGARRKR